jgi:hypothetical protein
LLRLAFDTGAGETIDPSVTRYNLGAVRAEPSKDISTPAQVTLLS